jgi:hypothetical protein
VSGEQGMASEEVVCDEMEVVACDDQSEAVLCADPEMVARDELWPELVQLHAVGDGRCVHGACAPAHYGRSVRRPATSHFGGSFYAQVHFAPSLMPWRMQPEPGLVQQPAESFCMVGRCHQHREPAPEIQLMERCNTVRRHCSRVAALLQERGEGPCRSCSCQWSCTTLCCLVCLQCFSIWRLI